MIIIIIVSNSYVIKLSILFYSILTQDLWHQRTAVNVSHPNNVSASIDPSSVALPWQQQTTRMSCNKAPCDNNRYIRCVICQSKIYLICLRTAHMPWMHWTHITSIEHKLDAMTSTMGGNIADTDSETAPQITAKADVIADAVWLHIEWK